MNLFDKAITFTDIHLGYKNNSKEHNEDCVLFIKFMIQEAKKRDIKTCIFMGDYFHNRSNVNISTLNYGQEILQMLNDNFDKTYFIVGNHDMYHKNQRNVTSVNMAKVFSNIHFINDIETIGDCTFIPFMVDDEYKTISSLTSKYVFGHLELPGYLLNKMVEMPDHGKETEESFNKCEYVFSGHFHKRQQKKLTSGTKIIYTGNCFPHNFSDAWDDERGIMILNHDEEPEFIKWDDAPKYKTFKMSDLLSDPELYMKSKTIAKILSDIHLNIDEIGFIRQVFTNNYNIREFNVTQNKNEYISTSSEDDSHEESSTETVDQIVISQIQNIESNSLNKDLLLSIYNSL